MEQFIFTDLFATKGTEYLFVIFFLVSFVLFWRYLDSAAAQKRSAAVTEVFRPAEWFSYADALYYHPGHAWARPQEAGLATVGVDDFTQKFVGTPSGIRLPEVGTMLSQGEAGWELQFNGSSVSIMAPMSGEVVEVNQRVKDNPDLINASPYEDGWLFKLRAPRLRGDLNNLLHGTFVRRWLEDTADVVSARMTNDLGVILQDGGVPVSGFAMELSPDSRRELIRDLFLNGARDEA